MVDAALVLEGGSLRGLYTSGVLDYFIEKNIEFSCVIGVSAGSLTGANYISKQKYRSAKINILHSNSNKYFGIYQLLTKGNAFNFDYLFNSPINNIYPYDINATLTSKQRFLICATDCIAGSPVYFEDKSNYEMMTNYLRASSSIPLLAKMININGTAYLDGGICEPIGIRKALQEKYKKIVVILTRDINYKKSKNSFIQSVIKVKYKKYPNLLDSLEKMNSTYNDLKETVDILEKKGDIFVIRPQKEVCIRRMEKRTRKLVELYFQGLEDAETNFKRMLEYLNS
ncbi:MAG: patatin family protein [Ruminiclostridium sp.]|nr:patatin family protein [Ruminiclostridium sp.]